MRSPRGPGPRPSGAGDAVLRLGPVVLPGGRLRRSAADAVPPDQGPGRDGPVADPLGLGGRPGPAPPGPGTAEGAVAPPERDRDERAAAGDDGVRTRPGAAEGLRRRHPAGCRGHGRQPPGLRRPAAGRDRTRAVPADPAARLDRLRNPDPDRRGLGNAEHRRAHLARQARLSRGVPPGHAGAGRPVLLRPPAGGTHRLHGGRPDRPRAEPPAAAGAQGTGRRLVPERAATLRPALEGRAGPGTRDRGQTPAARPEGPPGAGPAGTGRGVHRHRRPRARADPHRVLPPDHHAARPRPGPGRADRPDLCRTVGIRDGLSASGKRAGAARRARSGGRSGSRRRCR